MRTDEAESQATCAGCHTISQLLVRFAVYPKTQGESVPSDYCIANRVLARV